MTKRCSKCGQTKPKAEFQRDKRRPDGFQSRCRLCHRREMGEYRKNKPDKCRDLNRTYNWKAQGIDITLEEFDIRLKEQGYKCAVCRTDTPGGRGAWHVDHCHETGVVRGLLCNNCNTAIGKLGDNLEGLMRAVDYLRRFECVEVSV